MHTPMPARLRKVLVAVAVLAVAVLAVAGCTRDPGAVEAPRSVGEPDAADPLGDVPEGVPPYHKPPVPPHAGDPPKALPGTSRVAGRLTADADTLQSGEHADAYTVPVGAGDSLVVEMTSTSFYDPYIVLTSPSGEQIEGNSSRAGGANWRVEAVAREAGTWRVLATTVGRAITGAYELTVTVTEAPR